MICKKNVPEVAVCVLWLLEISYSLGKMTKIFLNVEKHLTE